MPPKIADLAADEEYYVERNLKALRNTRIGNLMGSCALTLPTGAPSCGITLTTLPMQEERLLRLGAAAEAALA
jgi:aspartyl-tRNA(Asn)/glutamyl-tRNA(Gln) amidotransferase subunit A